MTMGIKKLIMKFSGWYDGELNDGRKFIIRTGGKGWNLFAVFNKGTVICEENIYSYPTKKLAIEAVKDADVCWWE